MTIESISSGIRAATAALAACGPQQGQADDPPKQKRGERYAQYLRRLTDSDLTREESARRREYKEKFGKQWNDDEKEKVRKGHPAYQTYLKLLEIDALRVTRPRKRC